MHVVPYSHAPLLVGSLYIPLSIYSPGGLVALSFFRSYVSFILIYLQMILTWEERIWHSDKEEEGVFTKVMIFTIYNAYKFKYVQCPVTVSITHLGGYLGT